VSSVPAEIAGVGPASQKPAPNRAFNPMTAGIGPEEYFVLSRVDGNVTVRELLMMTGLPVERGIEILIRLNALGAIRLPAAPAAAPRVGASSGASPALATPGARTSTPAALPVATPRIGTPPTANAAAAAAAASAPSLPSPNREEQAALDEPADLSRDDRVRVLLVARRVATGDPWQILDVPAGTDKKTIKRAYFRLSKDVHPDRFYKKQLGSFAERLAANFEAVTRAYQELTEGKPRAGAAAAPAASQEPQSPAEYAAELFGRATDLEVHGQPLDAMKLFAAAIRVDPQLKYLRRAASCALAAQQPRTAEEYANKATAMDPSDGSLARLLAAAFRQQGKLDAAEEVLVMAMAIPSDKDNLVLELRRELAEVRKAQAAR
jgi:tetratricopeptide (TPR) repeat protein